MGFTSHRGFESRPLRSPPHRDPRTPVAILGGHHAPVAQLDRASVYGTEGQRFESSRARSAVWPETRDPGSAIVVVAVGRGHVGHRLVTLPRDVIRIGRESCSTGFRT